jgi:starch synthase
VARLSHQKGIDLVEEIAPWLGHLDVQVVMLGSGSERYEQFFRDCERRWPKKMRGWVGFSEKLAHRIEAGADIFLMPSRFEPCGLNQMYSLRYGTVPIVHRTGGLADTVQTFDPSEDRGTGWAFAPLEAWRFQRAVELALITFKGFPDTWKRIQGRGMALDLTWDRSAARYEALYEAARG